MTHISLASLLSLVRWCLSPVRLLLQTSIDWGLINNRNSFSQFLRLRSFTRSRYQQIRCLVAACFQLHRGLSFPCVPTWWKRALWHLFYKSTNHIHKWSVFKISERFYPLIPSHWGLGIYEFEEDISDHSKWWTTLVLLIGSQIDGKIGPIKTI